MCEYVDRDRKNFLNIFKYGSFRYKTAEGGNFVKTKKVHSAIKKSWLTFDEQSKSGNMPFPTKKGYLCQFVNLCTKNFVLFFAEKWNLKV